MPKGVYPRKPKPPKQYDPELVEKVASLYVRGASQSEIAQEIGATQKVVWRIMQNHGIPARKAAKRDQRGEKNHMWKGDDASYKAFHQRIVKRRGQPKKCELCGTTDPSKHYDWASRTGRYEDPADYFRLCRSCHWVYDERINNIRNGGA